MYMILSLNFNYYLDISLFHTLGALQISLKSYRMIQQLYADNKKIIAIMVEIIGEPMKQIIILLKFDSTAPRGLIY